jgi:hypothetical protein
MKTNNIKGLIALGFTAVLFFTSCLKDDSHYFDPLATTANVAELPLSGLNNFSKDARTKNGIDTITFAVGVTSAALPTSATTVTIGIDNTLIGPYNLANTAVTYLPVPAAAMKLASTSITIPAGQNSVTTTLIIDRTQLDPSKSYMFPVRITDAGGLPISSNYGIHYYHIIGNDFAGSYIWDYRRYNNGLAGGTSAGTTLGSPGVILPISPTEFQMETGYNGNHVLYDITFTRTVGSGGVVTYTNWAVKMDAASIAGPTGWTQAGISLIVPPVFTVPPPANNSQPKVFEMNYQAGGASPRYIDDTYH